MESEFKEFVLTCEFDLDTKTYRNGDYGWTTDLPYYDFNKEIVPPGILEQWPDGAVGIRVDDNFWAVASLPYKFKDLDTKFLINNMWPTVKVYKINPDYIETIDNVLAVKALKDRKRK